MSKKMIVTGATSFIGIYLTQLLLKKGYEVVAIIRPCSARRDALEKIAIQGLKIIECEISDLAEQSIKYCNGAKCMFHIAWTSEFDNARYNLNGQKKNIEYCLGAIKFAKRCSCSVFLSIGSQAECGRVNSKISPDTPDNPDTAYAIAKCQAYQKGKELCESYGIRFCWPRLLSGYGPYDKPHTMIMSCLKSVLNNEIIELTACEQIWDYVFVEDIAQAIYRVALKGRHGVKYTIASGCGRPLYEYVREIAFLNKDNKLENGIGKKKYSKDQVMYLVGDISLTTKDTGYFPQVDFLKGIEKTAEYIMNGKNEGK